MRKAALTLIALSLALPALAGGRKRTPKFKAPGINLKQRLNWHAQREVEGGPSLAFGGHDNHASDGRPHTRIKEGGAWKRIDAQLRKKNPLQKYHARARALREALFHMTSRARHIYFEGRTESEEKKFLAAKVNPGLKKCEDVLAALVKELKGLSGLGKYEAGQVKFALSHLGKAAPTVKPIGGRVEPALLAAMRQAQVHIEIAAEAFDAEPPPRVLSPLVFEQKTKLFVVFGGDHFDYLTNDLWVFDAAKNKWTQRHPKGAPAPRGGHKLSGSGDGKVTLSGGYTYSSKTDYASAQYLQIGGGEWTYDVAKNAWSGSGKLLPADTRVYRKKPYIPEHFADGPRPDAAANEKKLASIPANTWVNMKPPKKWGRNRDWGTVAYDPDRDLVYDYSGGHCAYTGTDVPHYHLSTNRWEQPVPTEEPLGMIGASGKSVPGVSFNQRPWMTNHTWNCYEYHPGLKKMLVAGRIKVWAKIQPDPYFYLYDPDKAEWTSRHSTGAMRNDRMAVQLLWIPGKGMLSWSNGLWLFDEGGLKWTRLKYSGKLPGPGVDACGLVHDPKRNRVLFLREGYSKPTTGVLYALDLATMKASALKPEGRGETAVKLQGKRRGLWRQREVAYHPKSDLFIWNARLGAEGHLPVYDPAKNRWMGLKLKGGRGICGHGIGFIRDSKRDLFWAFGARSQVYVFRLDLKTAKLEPLKDLKPATAATRKRAVRSTGRPAAGPKCPARDEVLIKTPPWMAASRRFDRMSKEIVRGQR
jgi:Galactose oxidase, central domain